MKKRKEEIDITKKLIKYLEKGYGRDKCKGYYPSCPNCDAQLLRGHLWNHLNFLEED